MNFTHTSLTLKQTGYFSKLVCDYVNQEDSLKPFFTHTPDWEGIEAAIHAKSAHPVQRETLVQVLEEQYKGLSCLQQVKDNIQKLIQPNTFSVCTAHQPNIFTGHLYVIYKILHAVKLAAACAERFPGYEFVPVYYMGSEDADLEELGHLFLNGEKLVWETKQTGAVGRMLTDDAAQKMLNRIAGELEVQPFGKELVQLLRECYQPGKTIQQASLELFNNLFGKYGLLVLIADHPALKKIMNPVFHDDLFSQTSSSIVSGTSQKLAEHYHVQAHPRDINLFYLDEHKRERIELNGEEFEVRNRPLRFSKEEMKEELEQHPEHFSPNVILRGLYQETILPNIAFIGGGGELSYWLQFKQLFEHYQIPFPVLVLRNSFLVIEEKWQKKITSLGLSLPEIFLKEQQLSDGYVKRHTQNPVQLTEELKQAEQFYDLLKKLAAKTDSTLSPHVASLEQKALHRLKELEKKMLRAEKRKFSDALGQIKKLREALFPQNTLQERMDNFMPGYAQWGSGFIDGVYAHSQALNAVFTVIHPQPAGTAE